MDDGSYQYDPATETLSDQQGLTRYRARGGNRPTLALSTDATATQGPTTASPKTDAPATEAPTAVPSLR